MKCIFDLYDQEMANDLDRSERTSRPLAELENAGDNRVRQGGSANRIFCKSRWVQFFPVRGNTCPMDVKDPPLAGQKLPASKTDTE